MENPICLNTGFTFKKISDNAAPAANASNKGSTHVLYTLEGVQMGCVGEAKGHGVHLERCFWEKIVELGNAEKEGVRARFGHPDFCSESLDKQLGLFRKFRMDKDICIADLEVLSVSNVLEKRGDYVREMAASMPKHFGNSIEFYKDYLYFYTTRGVKIIEKSGASSTEEGEEYSVEKHGAKKGNLFIYPLRFDGSALVENPASNNGKGLFSNTFVQMMRRLGIGKNEFQDLKNMLDSMSDIPEAQHKDVIQDDIDMKKFSLTSQSGLGFHFEKNEADGVAIPTVGDRMTDADTQPANGNHSFSYGGISFEVVSIGGIVSEVKPIVASAPPAPVVDNKQEFEAFKKEITTQYEEKFEAMKSDFAALSEKVEGLINFSAPPPKANGGGEKPARITTLR